MNNLFHAESAKRNEMIGKWESWAKDHQVSFPKAFNMYQFLNAKKQKQRKAAGVN